MDALTTINRLAQGQLLDQLSERLTQAAEDAVESGQPCTVTLKLKVSPQKGGDNAVGVLEELTYTSPKPAPLGAIFFVHAGELHKADPRSVPLPTFEIVDGRPVDTTTGGILEASNG